MGPRRRLLAERAILNQGGTAMADQTATADKITFRTMSADGLAALQKHEGFSAKLYDKDGGGNGGNCTIGYGHLVHTGKCASADSEKPYAEGIATEDASKLLVTDIADAEQSVRTYVKVDLNQNQFDALVSFVYNAGAANFGDSTMLTLINKGKFEEAADEFDKWVYSGGKKVNGLVNRRADEKALFQKAASPAPTPPPAASQKP
jgi:GH24 family phage-related lysozyme (muramidase)